MSHADVLALLEAATLTPGRLRALVAAETEEGAALRGHLADCADCRRELDAWQAVDEALVAVAPVTLTAPPAAKGRIIANVLATGVARSPDRVLGAVGSGPPAVPAVPPAVPAAPPTVVAANPVDVPAPAAVPAPAVRAAPAPTPTPIATGEPPAPNAGRVWRTPGGAPLPSPTPTVAGVTMAPAAGPAAATDASTAPSTSAVPEGEPATPAGGKRGLRLLPGGGDGEGVGFRVFLAVAAAAVFLFALGAALGGPLGLTSPQTVRDTTARVELEKVMGRMSDLLQLPGATVAPLTDRNGEPAGAVVLALPETNLLGVVTRALPPLDGDARYVCILVREDERFEIGYMKFAADALVEGDVAYWVGPLSEDVPLNAGLPGDKFRVYVEGDTGGEPLLTTTF